MAKLGNNLPSLDFNAFMGEDMMFSIPTAQEKMNEVTGSVVGKFGGDPPFSKIGALSPTLEETQANVVMGRVVNDPYANAPLDNYLTSSYKDKETPAVSAKSMNAALGKSGNDSDHKVKLVELVPGTNQETYTMFFEVMPEVTESRSVSYEAIAPAQFPGAFQKYKNTESTQWTVNATFISRTTAEATQNLEYVNRLRAWTMPYYGDVTGAQYPERLGAPPPVLILSGFRKHMIGPVPVVLTSLNWNFPKDVDYIPAQSPTGGGLIPFPTVIQIGIQLIESFSTAEFNNFSLNDFRLGDFGAAFSGAGAISTAEPIVESGAQEAQTVAPNSGQTPLNTDAANDKSGAAARGVVVSSGPSGGRSVSPAPKTTEERISVPTPIVSGRGGSYAGGGASGKVSDQNEGGW